MNREYRKITIPVGLRPSRGVYVALAVLIGVSVAGFFVGVSGGVPGRETKQVTRAAHPDTDQPGQMPAVDYRWMDGRGRGPNRDWKNSLPERAEATPNLFKEVRLDPQKKAEAIENRAQRRAYDGAPPTVPHPIVQHSSASCLSCHGEGLKVENVTAPKISHEKYTSCTQCHVESQNKSFPAGGELTANTFAGTKPPTEGERAWPGAPPAIPHSTWMRNDCTSCHGPVGASPLRTTHPWRVNCNQCHGQSAELNQQPLKLSDAGGER